MKNPSYFLPHWHLFKANLKYLLSGKLRTKQGNTPHPQHVIPADFAGVCVATSQNPATDNYLITQLKALNIQRVRLDFTYGDLNNHVARFLSRLIARVFYCPSTPDTAL